MAISDRDENGFRGFMWKGKVVRTYGEIGDAACALETPQEAGEFLDAYQAVNEYARANIGYLMGYYGPEERERVYRLMDEAGRAGVEHPVFGAKFGRGSDPTPEEAFEAGMKLARDFKKGKDEMSWWVGLENAGPVESFEEGGTYVLGGSDAPDLNVTYNYGRHFAAAFDGLGFRDALDGKRAGDVAALLEAAVARLGTERSADYWEATEGNAGHALSVLLGWAKQYPDGVFYVH